MPWIEATLRGQRVLARARADGTLAEESGRVEIRYKPTDGKSYRAGMRNLEVAAGAKVHPDETCVAVTPGAETPRPAKAPQPQHRAPADAWIAYTDGACSGRQDARGPRVPR
jgi:ribonuclease HI